VGLWPYLAGSFRSHGCQPFVGAVVRFRHPIGHSFGRRPSTKGVPSLQAIVLGSVSLVARPPIGCLVPFARSVTRSAADPS
jgi:hypothetical protein